MGKVYRIGSVYGTTYTNTAKEADRIMPAGEQPESVICLDAASECNHLIEMWEDSERTVQTLRRLLSDLLMACSDETMATRPAKVASDWLESHPLSPATSADRGGRQSYGR